MYVIPNTNNIFYKKKKFRFMVSSKTIVSQRNMKIILNRTFEPFDDFYSSAAYIIARSICITYCIRRTSV